MSAMYPSLMPDMIGIDAPPDRAVEIAARHGFAGVDLRLTRHLDRLEKFGPDRFADHMAAHRVRPGYGSMLTRTLSAEPAEWDDMLDKLPRIARLARQLGFTRAGVVVLPFDDDLDSAANRRRHLDRLRQVGPVLEDHGIRVGLEYVSPLTRRRDATHPFIHDLKATRQLIADAGRPNVGIMLDSFHWHCAGETTADLTALDRADIVVVHINDAPRNVPLEQLDVRERELPGETGVIDLRGIMRALAEVGYDGPVTSEPTHPRWANANPDDAAAMTGRAVRDTLRLADTPLPERRRP